MRFLKFLSLVLAAVLGTAFVGGGASAQSCPPGYSCIPQGEGFSGIPGDEGVSGIPRGEPGSPFNRRGDRLNDGLIYDGRGGAVSANPPSIGTPPPNLENDYLYPPGYRRPRYRDGRRHSRRHARRYQHRRHYRSGRRYRQKHFRQRHYRKRRVNGHRSYRGRHAVRGGHQIHGRTKFCSDHLEPLGHGKAIRRCVYVRNDLLGH